MRVWRGTFQSGHSELLLLLLLEFVVLFNRLAAGIRSIPRRIAFYIERSCMCNVFKHLCSFFPAVSSLNSGFKMSYDILPLQCQACLVSYMVTAPPTVLLDFLREVKCA